MKAKVITYWTATVLLCGMMGMSAYQYLTHTPQMMQAFQHLGYPSYFPNILGTAKVLGILALLVPGLGLVKEWAYAGFGITFISAFVSHIASGDGPQRWSMPLIALALLIISHVTRPASRRAQLYVTTPVEKSGADYEAHSRPAHA